VNEQSRLQLERYLQLVNRRKWVLVLPIVLSVLGAALLSYLTEPVYEATAVARVNLNEAGIDTQDPNSADRFLFTYSEIIRTNKFLNRVSENLDLGDSSDLGDRVEIVPVEGTELLEISAKANDADVAAAIANELANLLRDPAFLATTIPNSAAVLEQQVEIARARLEDAQGELARLQAAGAPPSDIAFQESLVDVAESSYQTLLAELENAQIRQGQAARAFTLIEAAEPPSAPIEPRWRFNLAAGLLAGLVAGVALSLVLEYVDPTLRGVRDLESVTRLPVLASIPFGVRWKYPPPPVSPDYRLLATKLQTALQESGRKSVLFTSTKPEEGNTTVATYSAMAMAQAGMRVLLLDANLSRPDVHKLFNLPLSPGLFNFISTNGARPAAPLPEAITHIVQQTPVPRLSVLTAGAKLSDPSEPLASAEMREFLDHVEREYDAVVIDGSAMSSGAGAAVIAPVADGVVLVAAEGQASSTSVEETVEELASLGGKTLGLVYCKATEV
jgi:succinoglycan biosynthesis transport protein ExoP